MLNKVKIFLYFDRAIITCLCFSIFCLPFTKAGVESFVWPAIFIWILKRALGYRAQGLIRMFPKTELNKALGIFMLINAVSMIFSAGFVLSWVGFFGKELKFIAIYFMLVEVINSRERLRNVLIVIVASAVLIIADAGVQYFRGADFLRGYGWARLRASFATASGFSGWIVVIIPLFLGMLTAGKAIGRSLKALLSILIVLLLVCLMMTYARGGWLGFVIGISLMAGYVFKNLTLKVKLLCSSVVIGLLAIFLIFPQPIKAKVTAIGRITIKSNETINARVKSTLKTKEGSTPMRFYLWKESLRIIRDYPLTGCGLNTYSIVAKYYKSFEGGGGYPHNSYLQMAAETGIPGLISFIWILIELFKAGFMALAKRKNPLLLGLLSGILAFLVQAFFDTHLYSLQLVILFWFVMGLTMAVIKIEADPSSGSLTF